jgi:hypothetical protein
LAALSLWGIRHAVPAADGLNARYFSGLRSDGPPAIVGVDREPSMSVVRRRWGAAIPETFSVTWRGYLTVPAAGTYELGTTSDDGSQLFVDDRLVVDNGGQHSAQTRTATVHLTSGSHRVMLVYTQEGGDLHLEWTWSPEGSAPAAVPAWLLSRRPTSYGAAVAARVLDVAIVIATAASIVSVAFGLLVLLRASTPRLAAARLRLSRLSLPAPRVLSGGAAIRATQALLVVATILPIALMVHALAFWVQGFID